MCQSYSKAAQQEAGALAEEQYRAEHSIAKGSIPLKMVARHFMLSLCQLTPRNFEDPLPRALRGMRSALDAFRAAWWISTGTEAGLAVPARQIPVRPDTGCITILRRLLEHAGWTWPSLPSCLEER